MPTQTNLTWQEGRLTKDPDLTKLPMVAFTIAQTDVRWNPETQQDELGTLFFAVDWWPVEPLTELTMLYEGDLVFVFASLGQSRAKEGDRPHTRLIGKTVTILRRSRKGAEAVAQARPPVEPF